MIATRYDARHRRVIMFHRLDDFVLIINNESRNRVHNDVHYSLMLLKVVFFLFWIYYNRFLQKLTMLSVPKSTPANIALTTDALMFGTLFYILSDKKMYALTAPLLPKLVKNRVLLHAVVFALLFILIQKISKRA